MTAAETLDAKRFTWKSKCDERQIEGMEAIRTKALEMYHMIIQCSPNCADRASAVRYLRLAVMQANVAIACENIEKDDKV